MLRVLGVVAAGCAATVCATPAVAAELTPDGPATLLNRWTGASTAEGRPPEVLVAARVAVGEGGRAGSVRIRARYRGVEVAGEPVELPADPGTYTFPAPHIRWDYRSGQIGIDQTAGGHALLEQAACDPALGPSADPCQIQRVEIERADGGEQRPGARLAVTGIFERDLDEDFLGDQTEDRTDLRLAATPARDADGRLRVAVTVTNAGPLTANLPAIGRGAVAAEEARWEGPCAPQRMWGPLASYYYGTCPLEPLAVGQSRTVTLVVDTPDAVAGTLSALSEGPDLVPADNEVALAAEAAPAFALVAAERQRLRRGVKVKVRGVRAGRARVTAAFRVRGRTVKVARTVKLAANRERAVTLRAHGAKLRSLRRAVRRGPVRAEITVRTISGKTPVSASTVIR